MVDTINVKDATGNTVEVATNDAMVAQLASILAKIIASPATEAKQDTLIAKDFATQTTLAQVLAKLTDDPATDTGLAAIATLLAGTLAISAADLPLPTGAATSAKQDTLIAKDFATQTTLAAVLEKLSGDPATQTTLAAVLAKLSSDPATDTGLSAIATILEGTLAVSAMTLPLPAGASTEASLNLVGTRAYDDASGQHVAYDGAAQSEAITGTEVTVVASTDCYIAFGTNPTATVGAGSMFLAAGVPFTRRITSGWKVSAIKSATAGALSILPVA